MQMLRMQMCHAQARSSATCCAFMRVCPQEECAHHGACSHHVDEKGCLLAPFHAPGQPLEGLFRVHRERSCTVGTSDSAMHCVYPCACVWVWVGVGVGGCGWVDGSVCVCARVCVYVRACVCACMLVCGNVGRGGNIWVPVLVRAHAHMHL